MEARTPSSRSRRRRPIALTERDLRLLAFAAAHRFVLPGQIALLERIGEAKADTRLRTLHDGGYVHRERLLHGTPPAHRITAAGLRAVGSELPVPRRPDLATYRHEAAVGWLMLLALRGRFGPVTDVVSERRMRSHDGRTTERSERFGVRLGGVGPGGRERLHHPDLLALTTSGHRVAFELELTTKSPARREQILAAYGADSRIDAVVYLVERTAAARAIQRSASRAGVSDLVLVQRASLKPPASRGGARSVAQRIQSRQHGPEAGR
ncbi:MAG: hypothetical protein WBQ18_01475 [Solirubrobacteraceae bacterium]